VPSFISSFRPLPHAWRSLVIAALFATGALAGYELFWRARGFRPTLTDSDALWCDARRRVSPDAVVIVGSSRLQTGLDPQVLSRVLGGKPVVQLAIGGANPVPALLDLTDDANFKGTVIFEYMPRRLFTPDLGSTNHTQEFVASCRNPSLVAPIEARLSRELERRLVLLNGELQFVALVSYVEHHHALPTASHDTIRDDRFSAIYFPEGQRPAFSPKSWDAAYPGDALVLQMGKLRSAIGKLTARGGRVILYRSPVSHEILDDEEHRFPAAMWFPRAATELGVPSIDYAALPNAPAVDAPDGEHPRSRDVSAITEAVGEAIRAMSPN
jgi:hypothetical protein